MRKKNSRKAGFFFFLRKGPQNTACSLLLLGPVSMEGSQAGDVAGWSRVINNSKVSDIRKNYAHLTYEGINPQSLLMARRCDFKCHKNLAFPPS